MFFLCSIQLYIYQFRSTFAAQRKNVVTLVPLSEWRSIDGHYGVFNEGLGSDQLVVRGVVNDIDYTSLAGRAFRTPRKVAGVKTQSSVLLVSSACTNLRFVTQNEKAKKKKKEKTKWSVLSGE